MDLTMAQATAHVLVKQGLAGDGLASVMDAVVATAGIYSTAPTCYLSCAARVRKFRVKDLDTELYDKRSIVRHRSVRGMAYIEPVDLMPALFACTGGETREKTLKRVSKWTELSEPEVLALADRIEEAIAGKPPMTVPEIRKELGDIPGNKQALQMTVALLGRYGRIVRAKARGTWRSDLYPYARWSEWLSAPVEEMEPAPARAEVARRYLRAFGPATADDLKWWSGWTKRDTVAALADLGDEAAEVSVAGTASWAPADELDTLAATDPEAGNGIRLLPVWDSYFMGYATSAARRARQVRPEDYPRVYDKAGNQTSTVIWNGVAAGVWELDADNGTLTVAPFGDDLPWDGVEAQAAALGEAIGTDLAVHRADAPGPLSDGPRNTFLSPISLRR